MNGKEEMRRKRQKFAGIVISMLKKRYSDRMHTELEHRNITELFVAVFLSPQCTDKQVNKSTKALFTEFRSFKDYADSDPRKLGRYLKGINYYKTKARNLIAASRIIAYSMGGKVPKTMEGLMDLPGIGRKVANVILNEGFGMNEGIAIDTHCITVSHRLGLTRNSDPALIEKDLMKIIPRKDWGTASNMLIALGKDTCKARTMECSRCVLRSICPSSTIPGKGKE